MTQKEEWKVIFWSVGSKENKRMGPLLSGKPCPGAEVCPKSFRVSVKDNVLQTTRPRESLAWGRGTDVHGGLASQLSDKLHGFGSRPGWWHQSTKRDRDLHMWGGSTRTSQPLWASRIIENGRGSKMGEQSRLDFKKDNSDKRRRQKLPISCLILEWILTWCISPLK